MWLFSNVGIAKSEINVVTELLIWNDCEGNGMFLGLYSGVLLQRVKGCF